MYWFNKFIVHLSFWSTNKKAERLWTSDLWWFHIEKTLCYYCWYINIWALQELKSYVSRGIEWHDKDECISNRSYDVTRLEFVKIWRRTSRQPAMSQGIRASPTDTRSWISVSLILAHRLRRWTNIKPTLVQDLVFTGSAVFASHNRLDRIWPDLANTWPTSSTGDASPKQLLACHSHALI